MYGAEDWAPILVTDIPATLLANLIESMISVPSQMETANAPQNTSPAPVLSTASTIEVWKIFCLFYSAK